MKRYICALFAATLLLCGCTHDMDFNPSSVETLEDGSMRLSFNLKMQDSEVVTVDTRAASQESNIVSGWAIVFGADPNTNNTFGDDSPLIQKVSFKTDARGNASVTLAEQKDRFCYIRLFANLTSETLGELNALVSEIDIKEGMASASELSTFTDYKHIDTGLDGYYASAANPDPTKLRASVNGFPCASPGIEMPDGLDEQTVAEIDNSVVYMVQVGSKLDVTNQCDFALSGAKLYNGAKRALMRSTVLEDDGLTEIASLPLPTNLGGVNYNFGWADAVGGTTAATPIYFFPNEGDDPYSLNDPLATYEGEDEDAISDKINGINPTYIIIKGRAAGYNVDGFYKIPINCTLHKGTRDILRNGYYKVLLKAVDNPGYATEAEAIAGPANDISYDIVVSTGDDSRNQTIVSQSGRFSMELDATKIYIKGYGTEGISGSFKLNVTDNNAETNYNTPEVTISGSTGITISNKSIAAITDGSTTKSTINFKVTQAGSITIRCADLLYTIPVEYDQIPFTKESKVLEVNGNTIFTGSNITDIDNESTLKITKKGKLPQNTSYVERDFAAQVYTTDMGAIKVYCKQASDFYLTNGGQTVDATTGHIVAYTARAEIWGNDASEKYLKDDTYTSDDIVTDNDDVYYKGVGVLSDISVTTLDETDYDAAGVTPDKNFEIANYLKNTYSSSTKTLRLYAAPITNYDLDKPATEYKGGFLLAPAQIATTITMENRAGDKKEYTLTQKLYPPIYLVTNSYGTEKKFNMDDNCTDYACVFALNMWNYDDTDSNYSWTDTWSITDNTSFQNSDEDMRKLLVPYLFTNSYINSSYNWTSDKSTKNIQANNLKGTAYNIPVVELKAIGGASNADAIIGIVRNTEYGGWLDKATGVVTFKVKDKFGDTYTTVKTLLGV